MEKQPLSEIATIKKPKHPTQVEPAPATPIKIYKCPFSGCNFEAFNYDDVTIHRIKQHADTPKFFTNDLGSSGGGFSKQQIRRQSNQVLKFKYGIIKMRLKIFLHDFDQMNKKSKEKNQAKTKARKDARAKAQEKKSETNITKV